MWKWLHPLAQPQFSYRLARRLQPWLMTMGLLLLVVGLAWGMLLAPADCKQGDGYRIIYLHVPTAFLSMSVYAGMALMAVVALVWQHRFSGYAVAACAAVGAPLTLLALATGAIWGKPMWGAWWVWDARLTSELILLFLYIGVLALYHGFPDRSLAGRASSILAVVGVINLPVIHYSVVWWNTLHQGATISKITQPAMAATMIWPLLVNLLAFALVSAALICGVFGNEMIRRELQRPWVREVLAKEGQR